MSEFRRVASTPRDRMYQWRLTETEHARLLEAASLHDLTAADLLRAALNEYLERHPPRRPKRKVKR